MFIPPEWVEEHRDEIKKMAYGLYEARIFFGQSDDPRANWTRAIEIVWGAYERQDARNTA